MMERIFFKFVTILILVFWLYYTLEIYQKILNFICKIYAVLYE